MKSERQGERERERESHPFYDHERNTPARGQHSPFNEGDRGTSLKRTHLPRILQ
jgi:hypothetical protein